VHKAWYKSKTVWSIAIGTLLAVQQPIIDALEKKSLSPAEAAKVLFLGLTAGVGIWGRTTADRPLGTSDSVDSEQG
jgi:hypothetical protein